MLPLLTKYLLRYKRVCIPHIGTFEIEQQPPQLAIAEKLITPPLYRTRYVREDAVPDHQFNYIRQAGSGDFETQKQELYLFGLQLKSRIKKDPFRWNGFGTLRFASDEVVFDPQTIPLDFLRGVPAHKVIRQNAAHSMLVGDRQTNTRHMSEELTREEKADPLPLLLGWILLVLSLLAIAYLLYSGEFHGAAAGMRKIQ